MTYRPWSSVTTILAYLVGSSVVSATTHTPASGPLGPRTTPPMSSLSMATCVACWAASRLGPAVSAVAKARTATLRYEARIVSMLSSLRISRPQGAEWRKGSPGRRNAPAVKDSGTNLAYRGPAPQPGVRRARVNQGLSGDPCVNEDIACQAGTDGDGEIQGGPPRVAHGLRAARAGRARHRSLLWPGAVHLRP